MKAVLLILFNSLKWAKFSKVFLSTGTILLSMWTYATIYGWPYGVGFVGLIFIHEMGHYIAARSRKMDVGLPTFIPFVGAFVELKDRPKTAEEEAYVAIAGPYAGTIAAFACYLWGRHTDSGLFMALAQAGFVINLFNLVPIYPLDGGRITAIISPKVWYFGVPCFFIMWSYWPSPMLFLIGLLAIPQLYNAWSYDEDDPDNKRFYNVPISMKVEYTLLYMGLAIVLALMINDLRAYD